MTHRLGTSPPVTHRLGTSPPVTHRLGTAGPEPDRRRFHREHHIRQRRLRFLQRRREDAPRRRPPSPTSLCVPVDLDLVLVLDEGVLSLRIFAARSHRVLDARREEPLALLPRAARRLLDNRLELLLGGGGGDQRRPDPLALEPSLRDASRDGNLGLVLPRAPPRFSPRPLHQGPRVGPLQAVLREGIRRHRVAQMFGNLVDAVHLAAFHQRFHERAYGPGVYRIGLGELPLPQPQLVHLRGHRRVLGDDRLVSVDDVERGSHLVGNLPLHPLVLRGGLLRGARELFVDQCAHVRLRLLDLPGVLAFHLRRLDLKLGVDVVDPSAVILARRLQEQLLLAELEVELIARGRELVHVPHRRLARGEFVLERRASRARVVGFAPLELGALRQNPLELLPRAEELGLLRQRLRVRRPELARQRIVRLVHHAPRLLQLCHQREILLGEGLASRLPSRQLRGEPLYLELGRDDLLLLLARGVRAGFRLLTVVFLVDLLLGGHVVGGRPAPSEMEMEMEMVPLRCFWPCAFCSSE